MRIRPFIAVLCMGLTVAACGSGGSLSPDEFEVMQYKPLVIPPEAELRPPRPGQPKAQSIDAGRQAFEALFPGAEFRPAPRKSDGELSILLNLPRSEPDVRSNVAQRELDVVKKALLLADILDAEERQFRPDNIEIRRLATSSPR